MHLSGRLNIRHLEVFVEVARHGSVSRAAEALNISQPAVSRTLRDLEELCGRALVEKQGRGIRLSPWGRIFLRHAGASLAAAQDGIEALRGIDAEFGPLLRIGALPTVSSSILPEAVHAFRAEGIPCRMRISSGENTVLLDRLRDGHLDLVVGRLPAPESMLGLSFEPLYREPVLIVVATGHPLAGRGTLGQEDLRRWPLIIPGTDSIIRPAVERLFLEQGLSIPPDAVQSVSPSFCLPFLQRAQAIWVISRGVVARALAEAALVALPVDTSSTLGAVGLCLRAGLNPSPATTRFVAALKDAAERAA